MMTRDYSDIINRAHYRSHTHRPMSATNRAAQFAPFAALSGHDEAISRAQSLAKRY